MRRILERFMLFAFQGNTDWQVTQKLVQKGAPELEDFFKSWKKFPLLKSFIHLHLGFRGDGLPPSHCAEFPAQWGVFNDWADLEAPRNAVLVSCPSMPLGKAREQRKEKYKWSHDRSAGFTWLDTAMEVFL